MNFVFHSGELTLKRLLCVAAIIALASCETTPQQRILAIDDQLYLHVGDCTGTLEPISETFVSCKNSKGDVTGYVDAITQEEAIAWGQQQAAVAREQQARQQALKDISNSLSETADAINQINQQSAATSRQWGMPEVAQPSIGSTGVTYTPVGDAMIGSNGVTYRRVGSTIVGSDGTRCQISGSYLHCR